MNVVDEASGSLSAIEARHPCANCQRRRVKCDRLSPCKNCVTHGHECKQPDSRRAPRKPRKANNSNVLERVRHLEDVIENIRAQFGPSVEQPHVTTTADAGARIAEPREEDPGHLVIQDDQSQYVSAISWPNLVAKMSEPKLLLPMALDGNQIPQIKTPPTFLPFLWEIYKKNIDPIMKVLHIPSMQDQLSGILLDPTQVTKATGCLVAVIKFAAVATLTDEQCRTTMGFSRQTLLTTLRSEVYSMLDESKFLVSHDMVNLQAFVIFLSCNMRHEHPQAMWISSGVVIRLAKSIGLHRDGTHMKLPVFVTEMRRRLWWQIRIFEMTSAEVCGFAPTHVYGEDVLLPLNINDEDITPGDTTWPSEKDGFTEMTHPLIRFEICNRLHGFRFENGKRSMGILAGDKGQINEQSRALDKYRTFIQAKFFQHYHSEVPLQRATKAINNIILSKVFLSIYAPLRTQRDLGHVPVDLINKLFITSCEVIEKGHEVIQDPETFAYTWQLQTFVNWHPVAFLSREICLEQLTMEQITRAWRAVTWAITDPHGVEPEANKALWKPLDGLISKAIAKVLELGLYLESKDTTPPSQSLMDLETPAGFEMTLEEMQDWLRPVDQSLSPLDINAPFLPYEPADDLMGARDFDPQYGSSVGAWPEEPF